MDDADVPRGAFVGYEGAVGADWIDWNGHMNVGWYDHVFDIAESNLFAAFGIDEDYIRATRHGMFRVEKSIRYEREALLGDRLRVSARIASFDGKVIRHVHELLNLTRGVRAARAEYVSLHVALDRRKVTPVTEPRIVALLGAMAADHGASAARPQD